MNRRDLIAMLGGVVVLPSLRSVAIAQAAKRRPVVGIISNGPGPSWPDDFPEPFIAGMRALGYVDGTTVEFVFRYIDGGRYDQLPARAEEIARLHPDVIVASAPNAAIAAKIAAPSVPIVVSILNDGIRLGLIASMAQPGGNVTGIVEAPAGLDAKQLEIAQEVVPGATRIGLLLNAGNIGSASQRQEIEAVAASRGVTIVLGEDHEKADIEPALAKLADAHVQIVIVLRDTLQFIEGPRIAERALALNLPTLWGWHQQVEAGGLIGYGVDLTESFRRTAYFVDRILGGDRPSDLPAEFPTRLKMAINLKTAKALGLTIPPTLLVRADEVIE